jgi:hypothetical protein
VADTTPLKDDDVLLSLASTFMEWLGSGGAEAIERHGKAVVFSPIALKDSVYAGYHVAVTPWTPAQVDEWKADREARS